MNYLDVTPKHQQRQHQEQQAETPNSTKKLDMKQGGQCSTSTEMQIDVPTTILDNTNNDVAQFHHHRIRELHGDHQPLYVAPPPPNFFPPFNPHSTPSSTFISEKSIAPSTTTLKAPLLVRSVSAAELPTSSRNLGTQQPKSLIPASARQPQFHPPLPQTATSAPVLATSISTISNVATPSPGVAPVVPPATPTKGKRGRKPKDPVAHAAKKEAKEKRRLEKEAAMAGVQQQLVFVAEEIVPVSTTKESTSRPSTSGGISQLESSTPPPSSFAENFESKKRTADTAFSTDMTTSWMGSEAMSIDVDSSWTMSTPLQSPIHSPQTGGLGIFLQAPPSTPIDEILSSSAHLGINPALLLQEDYFPSSKLIKPLRALKSPLEILDEYPLQAPHSPIPTSSNRPSTPSEDSGLTNKKLGLMDLMLLRQASESEDKPSPKKKPRPDLVFSTTKRGKAIVSLQKTTSPPESTAIEPPTTPLRESPTDNDQDLRSLVLKRRQEVWGDEVGTEVTRITVHRRLTARKNATGLMSPLSPKSSLRRSSAETTIIDSESDSSESSDSEEDDDEHPHIHTQVTPLATPTNPRLLSTATSQSMQKSFSAPGFFHHHLPTENIFLPSTPQPPSLDDTDDYPPLLLPSHHLTDPHQHHPSTSTLLPSDDPSSSMRCKTCGMLFRKLSILGGHERTCMVKQTPFIPYDFLKSDAHGDDGFVFSTGRTLFADEAVVLTPRNLAVQMGFEMSPLLGGKMKGGFVAPRDTVSSEEEEGEERGKMRDVVVEKKRSVVGEPKGTTRCICNKPEKAVAGVMVQW